MKSRFVVLVAAMAGLMASTAFAAPVFMLQFGSFETQDEATQRLAELKTKHAGVLGQMTASIREVKLPPDNLTVYRTQAGPLNTRADAQSVCSQLASNGDECYVVETAMVQHGTVIGTQSATPAPQQMAAATPAAATVAPAAATQTPAPLPTLQPLPLPNTATPDQKPSVGASSSAATPVSNGPVPPVAMSGAYARDPQNVAAMQRVVPTTMSPGFKETPAPVMATSAARVNASGKTMDQELAEAAAKQSGAPVKAIPTATPLPISAPAPKATVVAQAEPEEESFWSRMNPFSDSKEEKAAAARADKLRAEDAERAARAAPVEPIIVAQPVAPVVTAAPMVVAAPAPAVITAQPAPMSALPPPAPLVSQQPVMVTAAPMVVTQPVPIESPLRLPPPPAPTNPNDRAALERGEMPRASAPAPLPVAVAPAPVIASSNAAPFVSGPSISPSGEAAKVTVAEAQRVPLSQASVMPPPPAPAAQPMIPMAMRPSATLGQKTLWAQIGQFADAQAALAFWDSYRMANPDFPVVRVRVTQPYQAQQRNMAQQVSLRVGPFARGESINNLCTTLREKALHCGMITDMGVASNPYGNRPGFLPGSRYQR